MNLPWGISTALEGVKEVWGMSSVPVDSGSKLSEYGQCLKTKGTLLLLMCDLVYDDPGQHLGRSNVHQLTPSLGYRDALQVAAANVGG
jgi:hypothetical protein